MLFLIERTVLRGYPDLAVCTMATICIESESTIDYGIVFKRITENAPVPISPLESLVLLQFEQLKRLCFLQFDDQFVLADIDSAPRILTSGCHFRNSGYSSKNRFSDYRLVSDRVSDVRKHRQPCSHLRTPNPYMKLSRFSAKYGFAKMEVVE